MPVLNGSRYEQSQVDDGEHGDEGQEDVIVLEVGGGESIRQWLPDILLRLLRHRHQPPIDTNAQVLQQSTVLLQLVFQRLVRDRTLVLRISVFEHGQGQILDLFVRKLHSVLFHARPDDVLQLLVLDQAVTVNVVHLKQELDLILRRLARELVNRVDEFLQRNRSRIVLVEDREDAIAEEGL